MRIREIVLFTQTAIAAIGGWLGWMLGGLDGLLYALITFVVMDYVLGVFCAIIERKLSSAVGAQGIFKKVVIFTLVGVAHVVDSKLIGDGSAIRTAVIFFYLSNEGISIIENATRLGLPVPTKLVNILKQLKDGGSKNGRKGT
jgi:toxin secretion/phage lysis holin